MEKVVGALRAKVPDALVELVRTLTKCAHDVPAFFDRPGTSNASTEAIDGRLEHLCGSCGSARGPRSVTNYIEVSSHQEASDRCHHLRCDALVRLLAELGRICATKHAMCIFVPSGHAAIHPLTTRTEVGGAGRRFRWTSMTSPDDSVIIPVCHPVGHVGKVIRLVLDQSIARERVELHASLACIVQSGTHIWVSKLPYHWHKWQNGMRNLGIGRRNPPSIA